MDKLDTRRRDQIIKPARTAVFESPREVRYGIDLIFMEGISRDSTQRSIKDNTLSSTGVSSPAGARRVASGLQYASPQASSQLKQIPGSPHSSPMQSYVNILNDPAYRMNGVPQPPPPSSPAPPRLLNPSIDKQSFSISHCFLLNLSHLCSHL